MNARGIGIVGVLIACVVGGVSSYALAEPPVLKPPAAEPGQPPWEYRLEDVRIELETHSPSGQCPLHLIAITGDGSGSWGCEGSDEAPLRVTVTEDEIVGFLNLAYNAYFFDMRPRYVGTFQVAVRDGGMASVVGTVVAGGKWRALTVTIGDYTKRVEAVDAYPEGLEELIAFLRRFADRAAEQLGGRPSN